MAYSGNQYTRDQDGVPPARSNKKGRPLAHRDYARMRDFNLEKMKSGDNWRWGEVAENDRYAESRAKWRENQRGTPRAPVKPAAPKQYQRSTVQTKPVDEDLYSGEVLGAVPVRHTLCHNNDFSSFSTILRTTYDHARSVEPRLDQMCPFPIYQHSMVEVLNARVMSIQKNELAHPDLTNKQDALTAIRANEMIIPKPVFEYINSIGTALTPTGDKVFHNLPTQAIPQGPVGPCTSGTFGQITAANHNVYEAYWSPYVTSQYIQATIQFNVQGGNNNWDPFPAAWMPENGVVNENLLGWRPTNVMHQMIHHSAPAWANKTLAM